MKILILADVESKSLWDFFERSKLEGIDLIISCGDLSPRYLSFLATFTHAPVLYVHGNHDACYEFTPPEGCTCIDDKIYEFQGVRIMGLGGSMRYKPGPFMYTQKEMNKRIKKMRFPLMRKKGIDILVTHSPAYHLNDGEDVPHIGFEGFIDILDKYEPKYFFHGHVHMSYGRQHVRMCTYKNTTVVNAYEQYIIDYEPEKAASVKEIAGKEIAEEETTAKGIAKKQISN